MATQGYGTLTTLDTLQSVRTSIADYGEDNAYRTISDLLAAYNMISADMLGDLIEVTADVQRAYGGASTGRMIKVDEAGRPDVSKVAAGVNVGFPLYLFQYGIGWTKKYMQNNSVADMAAQVQGAMTAHQIAVQNEIKTAIFTPTNNSSYRDTLVRNSVTLTLRAFLNADSAEIPNDPWGNSFDGSTHTHYLAYAALTTTSLSALITAVREHYNSGQVIVYINQAQEATARALTGFTAYVDARIVQPTTATYAVGALDTMNIYDRPIGIYDGAEVWVKPWMPASYAFAFNPSQRKPLAMRTRTGSYTGLQIAAQLSQYPLYAEFMEDEFGIGVQERANGAILYIGSTTYATPAFT